ncbi:MAG: class I SAM-dependent methyltransferase [Xanthobacteraceae bacterium]
MPTQPQLDPRYEAPEPPLQLDKMFKFQQRIFFDMSAALGALAGYLGDKLGLLKALSALGPVSAAEFARRQQLCPEMTAEWLRVMTCAGYLERDHDGKYSLPPEHAMIVANDGGPMCFAGGLQQIGSFADQLPRLLDAFRNGGGVPQAAYSSDLREGMERLSATWFEHELVEHWLASLPLASRLHAGATVADVGCGAGRAVIAMAKAFPASRFTGFDAFAPSIERATRNAAAAGVAERVSFEVRDVTKGLSSQFDLVTAFDSLHDMPDPVEGLAAFARGLKKDGTLLVLEIGAGDDSTDEAGPVGVVLHATKLFYNLPVGLASSGSALGNTSFSESHMKSLCRTAGLTFERTLPVRNPLHKLYVIRKSGWTG